jgi:hypothetical protein
MEKVPKPSNYELAFKLKDGKYNELRRVNRIVRYKERYPLQNAAVRSQPFAAEAKIIAL